VLNELAPGVWWMPPDHTTDRPVLAAVAGDDATLMVDAGASGRHAREFLAGLAATPAPPVRHVVLTHSHWDHVFGAPAVDAVVISTEETRDRIATMASWSWSDADLDERVAAGLEIAFCRDMMKAELSEDERTGLKVRVPEQTFRTERTIDLGGRAARLVHVGGDHASDSCIVVVPGVAAFLSDCLYRNLHVEPDRLTRRRLFPLLDRLLALDVEHYVLGHHDAPLPRRSFESLARVMRIVGEAVEAHGLDDDAIQGVIPDAGTEEDRVELVRAFQAGLPHETG
jgi:glyoxylase-like metal-dependent hydrolase (beta-lactamase superfamily II)